MNEPTLIRVWPDGDTQVIDDHENKEPYSWKSDDFQVRETEVCIRCDEMIIPEYGTPFAGCKCGTMEWYR